MSVVNEINAHFNGLHRDLKELHNQIRQLSFELQDKEIGSFPDLAPQAKGLLPGIASRQMDLNKIITTLAGQVNFLRGVVNPAQPTTAAKPTAIRQNSQLSDAELEARVTGAI